ENDASVRRGEWDRAGSLTPWDLNGRTVGIVGLGDIGSAVAQRLAGFGVRLLVSDPAATRRENLELVDLPELLERADIVTLHLPLQDATRHLIGARELGRMDGETILVNTSRGGLIDEPALIDALSRRRLRAAALDVFEDEPPVSDRLRRLPNVVLSPHIAGLSHASIAAMTRQATKSILDTLAGRLTPAVRNPAALASDSDGGRGSGP
ncbi:MAG: 2-hydroxyacid dehydrogenase, partial [Thermoleophilaceae bacterium]